MELFTLGASNESGYPYSEDDVREQARALTGWRADCVDDVGYADFHFDAERHDGGSKTIFGQPGAFDWRDSCRLCVEHSRPQELLRREAVELLHPDAPVEEDAQGARAALRQARPRDPPGGRGDPHAPDLYRGPAMVKPPAVYIAGLLRARRRGIRPATTSGSPTSAASGCSGPRTSRAGTTPAGSTPRPSAGAGWPPT